MLNKIISGGQTGADRAALDAALDAGFPAGGSCPAGRQAEDGPIDERCPSVYAFFRESLGRLIASVRNSAF